MAADSSGILALMPTGPATWRAASKPKLVSRATASRTSGEREVTNPPSPMAKGFVAWKLKTSASPRSPSGRPSSSTEPKPAAESTTTGTPSASTAAARPARRAALGATPKVEHCRMPASDPRTRSSPASDSSDRCQSWGSMSTNTGSKPAQAIALMVATNVNDGTATSRRGPSGTPKHARSATSSPEVALLTATPGCSRPR